MYSCCMIGVFIEKKQIGPDLFSKYFIFELP